jgi:hypothetical protein
MKHLKKYETWTSDVTDNVIVNYGDKGPEISKIVKDTENYINNNFDNIRNVDSSNNIIKFDCDSGDKSNGKIIVISITRESPFYTLKFTRYKYGGNDTWSHIDITKGEYEYLDNFIYDIGKKYRIKEYKRQTDEISNIIDPAKIAAKKFNL